MTRRTFEQRLEDVRAVVRAARAVAESRAGSLTDALVASTGLSREGVELAFERHLELTPSEEDLTRLVRSSPEAEAVAVILAANVFVGGLRSLALARASAREVVVRPSRREPVFARALVDEMRAGGDAHVRLEPNLDVATLRAGEVYVYGQDRTISEVRARTSLPVRGHGSGIGIAWLTSGADLAVAARLVARDVVAFDQRGCLSPRIAVVVGTRARADAFGQLLHDALDDLAREVPRGTVHDDEAAEIARYRATMVVAHAMFEGTSHLVGIAPSRAPLILPPPCRTMHIAHASTVAEGKELLQPWERFIVAFGCDDPAEARLVAPTWARRSPLGAMQTPAFDGPVDGRPA